jgi:hypothetical protein
LGAEEKDEGSSAFRYSFVGWSGTLEIDNLVTLSQDLLILVQHDGLDEPDPPRAMNDSSCGFQAIPRLSRGEEVHVVLNRYCGFPEAISCRLARVIGQGEEDASVNHLKDVDMAIGDIHDGLGMASGDFNDVHADGFGKGISFIDLFE